MGTNGQLHHELQDAVWQMGQQQQQVTTLQADLAAATHKLAAAQEQLQVEAREVHALKAEVAQRGKPRGAGDRGVRSRLWLVPFAEGRGLA